MNYMFLDEYVAQYGFDNATGIDDIKTAMKVNQIGKDKENEALRNDICGAVAP